jgi:hypothetical protein
MDHDVASIIRQALVFGPMLRRYAPSDTYDVTKRGSQLRMDGTLKVGRCRLSL